jgi:two-component system NtrC family sensor kinase
MAERLEAHEAERSNFEAELARQVKERTRQLEEITVTLRATQAQLIRSEQIALTGQIAAGVTHEIRTPLNSLAINVQLLRRELSGQAPPSQAAILDTLTLVEYEITRINRTLEEFVKFARLPTPRCERVEIGPLLEEILELLRPQAREAGVRLETAWTSAVGPVAADRDQLREVFLNLGQNALHAMPNGGTLDVAIGQAGDGRHRRRTGAGRAGGGRSTSSSPRATGGRPGLGLAIAGRIVEEHGGASPPNGSTAARSSAFARAAGRGGGLRGRGTHRHGTVSDERPGGGPGGARLPRPMSDGAHPRGGDDRPTRGASSARRKGTGS